MKPGADTDDQVGLCGQFVATAGAGHAGGAEVQFVLPIHRALARLGFHHRDVVALGKVAQGRLSPGIDHPAARHDERVLCGLDRGDGFGQLAGIGFGTADVPDFGGEKLDGVIIGFGLRVLTKGQTDRPAIGRIGHHPQRAGQGGEDVFGP